MLTLGSRVRLAPGNCLRYDPARARWVLQGPGRLLELDDVARAVLERTDDHPVSLLCETLASDFAAPLAVMQADVLALLAAMNQGGFLRYD